MEMCHHAYIFELYLLNPYWPIYGYCKGLERTYGLHVSNTLIQDWFVTLGPFKGTIHITSRYPLGRNSLVTYQMLEQYINFIKTIKDHIRLIFVDEKPIKEIDVFKTVRQIIATGEIPNHSMNTNSKNRYNIITSVT